MKPVFEQINPEIRRKASALSAVTHFVQTLLPSQAHAHFHVSKLDTHCLTITVDNAVWATRIRQLGPQILQALGDERQRHPCGIDLASLISPQLRHIKVVTRPGAPPSAPAPSRRRARSSATPPRLGASVCQRIAETAEAIRDESLKASLRKLASRGPGR